MCIFEFDEEKYMESEREYAYKNGFEEGERRILQLIQFLKDEERNEDISLALSNPAYREQLYRDLSERECSQQ